MLNSLTLGFDMTETQSGLERSIGRLEGKVDLMLKETTSLRADFQSLEQGRLSRLEVKVEGLVIKMTIIVSIISAVVSLLLSFGERYFFK